MLYSKLAGFLALLGFLLQRVAAESDDAPDVECKLAGTYAYDSDPNDPKIGKLLVTIGYSRDDIKKMQALAPGTKKVISFKDGVMTLKLVTKVKTQETSFENGKQFTETPMIGVPVKTTATIEKSKLTLVRKTPSGMEINEILTCTEEGCVSAYTAKDAKAEIKWKRIEAETEGKAAQPA